MRCARAAATTWCRFSCYALDLAEDRIERMLQRAVELVPLRRPQLVEVRVDLLARPSAPLFAVTRRCEVL